MAMIELSTHFFLQPTRTVARALLGCILIRRYRGKIYAGVITETEAYCGPNDLASHACLDGPRGRRASRGRTARTATMFGLPGHIYIYLIYGMYYCLNIVTEKNDYPAAVLIRAVQAWPPIVAKGFDIKKLTALNPLPEKLTNGPGKLCRYFHIDRSLNAAALLVKNGLWVLPRIKPPRRIITAPRVGVDYAGKYRDKPWRYIATLE